MSSVREKLLEAVADIDLGDVEESALVDILVAKIEFQAESIASLGAENAMERQRLYDAQWALRGEQKKLCISRST